MHIAIIGAGLAGVTCARRLQSLGHGVRVYEKNETAGGRMATRETELGGFDHGTQYFTAQSDAFRQQIGEWQRQQWVDAWNARLVTLENGKAKAAGLSGQRFVGVPGMGSLARRLAQGLPLRAEQRVRRIERFQDQWLLAVQSDTVAIDASAGPFDTVLVALPAGDAAPLLQAVPEFAHQARCAPLVPCWTLLLAFQDMLGIDYDGAWVQESRLSWIVRDSSKPGRRPGEHWVAHASPEWSSEHLEDDSERVREKLLRAFHEATDTHVQPVYAEVCLWRHAKSGNSLQSDCMWDPDLRIGACGDWFAAGLPDDGRVENAWLSGLALAEAIGPA